MLSKFSDVTYIEPFFINFFSKIPFLSSIETFLRFLGYSISNRYDLLLLQKPWIFTLPYIFIAKTRKKKVVVDMDDLDSLWQSNKLKTAITRLGERVVPLLVNAITTHNKYLLHYLKKRFNKQFFLLPQGVDSSIFNPKLYDKIDEKKRLGLENKTVLCFLGSFTVGSSRDLHTILKAFSELVNHIQDAVLLILGGEGPMEKYYLEMIDALQITSKVTIAGHMDQKEIPRFLSSCDYGLIFMREDLANRMRVSLKLLEYLSMDLTVIGHVVGSSRDELGSHCFLCEENVKDFTETIKKVIKYNLKHETTHEFINNKYNWNSFLPHVKSFLDKIN